MIPTPEQIEAVRRDWPAWDTQTIVRHLQQRARLSQIAMQQRRTLAYVPTPMVEPR
jgi:hypothetical protein